MRTVIHCILNCIVRSLPSKKVRGANQKLAFLANPFWLSCKSSRKGRGQRMTGRNPGFSKQNRTEVPERKAEVDRRVRIAPHKSVIAGGLGMAEHPTRDE